jgi:hypothetical protein
MSIWHHLVRTASSNLTVKIINYAVEAADKALGRKATGDVKNTDGLASVIAPLLRDTEKTIEGSWKHLMDKFPTSYEPLVMPY